MAIDGSSSVHPIRAAASGLDGWIELDLDGAALAAEPAATGGVRIEVARLRSGNPLVDAETRRRIDAGRFPEIVGEITGSTRLADDRLALTGDLTFRGVTQPVHGELVLVLAIDGGGIGLAGEEDFDVRAWGLQPPRIGLLRVHPTIRVRIEAVGGPA